MKTKLCFFDDFYIASRVGTLKRNFRPQKVGEYFDGNPPFMLYTSFFFDERINKFRLYYESQLPGQKSSEVRRLMLVEAENAEDIWEGRVTPKEIEGLDSQSGIHGCSVAYCPEIEDAQKRYILVGNVNLNKRYMVVGFSADGERFSPLKRVYPNHDFRDYADTYNSVYYNPYAKEYTVTTRCAISDRRVAMITSKDGEHWSEPRILIHPTNTDSWGVQHYAMGVSRVDGMFYGLLWRYMTDLSHPDLSDLYGYMDNDLLYSYDGVCFAPAGATPICERPLPPEYGCKQLFLLNICEDRNGEYLICGSGSNICHGGVMHANQCHTLAVFYRIRKDGFTALEGFGESSRLVTKPLIYEGGESDVNVNALGGTLSFEIQDRFGEAIEGFRFDDCIPISGKDSIGEALLFKEHRMEELRDRQIRFAFRLDNVLLYSMTFDGRPRLHARLGQKGFQDHTVCDPDTPPATKNEK